MVTNLLEDDDEEEDEIGEKTGDTSSSSKIAQEDFEQTQPGEEGKGLDDDSSPEYNPDEDDDEDSDMSESTKPVKKEKKQTKASPNKGAAPIAIEADGVTLSRDTTIKVFNCLEVDCRTVADVAKEFGMSVAV